MNRNNEAVNRGTNDNQCKVTKDSRNKKTHGKTDEPKITGTYPKMQETINLAANAKSVRLDVYVEDEQNTVYNIEMQITLNKNLPQRSR